MTNYNILITSDIVCPWCYIGHSRLSRAIQTHQKQYPEDTFTLTYEPFYLNPPPRATGISNADKPPAFPVKSRPRREMYAEKFGAQRTAQMEAMMTQVSNGEGLHFKFGGMTGPSRNGHRLVHYAQTHGGDGEKAQNEVMLGLWQRYFEREIDITDLDVLVETGVEVGLGSAADIKTYLESGQDMEKVDALAEDARDKGISGVPHYEIQGRWDVSGAQEPVAFERLFKRWKDMEEKNKGDEAAAEKAKNANGSSCL